MPRREWGRCPGTSIGIEAAAVAVAFLAASCACRRAQVGAGERVVVAAAGGRIRRPCCNFSRSGPRSWWRSQGRDKAGSVESSEPTHPACMAGGRADRPELRRAAEQIIDTSAAACSRDSRGNEASSRYEVTGFTAASGARGDTKWTTSRLKGSASARHTRGSMVPDADLLRPSPTSETAPGRRTAPGRGGKSIDSWRSNRSPS